MLPCVSQPPAPAPTSLLSSVRLRSLTPPPGRELHYFWRRSDWSFKRRRLRCTFFQSPVMYITRQCVTTHVENGWVLGDLGKLWRSMRVYFWAWKKWKIYTENIKLKAIKYRNDWHCHSLRSYRSKNWHVSIFSLVPQSEKQDCELWKMFQISVLTGGASAIVFNVKSSV